MPYQHIKAYSRPVKFTPLIPGDVCVQTEGMIEAYENFSIDPAPYQKNPIKK